MYWQVYMHKTAVAYEKVLVNVLTRAKDLTRQGHDLFASPALKYFLQNDFDRQHFDTHEAEALQMYSDLDDSDIWSALKVWRYDDDTILSTLATDMLDRHIFKSVVSEEPFDETVITEKAAHIANVMGISETDARRYMMSLGTMQKDMYSVDDDSIDILYKDGTIRNVLDASEIFNVHLLSRKVRKYFLCYHRT